MPFQNSAIRIEDEPMRFEAPHCLYQGLLADTAQRKLCENCRVKGLSICGGFAVDHAEELAGITQRMSCTAGSTLFTEGDPADSFYTVTEGVVQFSKYLLSGRRQILGFLLKGDFLGLAVQDQYSYTAEATTNCTLCQFNKRQFEKLMGAYPTLEHTLFNAVSNELIEVENRMVALGHQLAEKRLAAFLTWYWERMRRMSPADDTSVTLPMTRRDIADYLCLSIEAVSRAFTKLRTQNIISLGDPQNVRILNLDKLKDLAES